MDRSSRFVIEVSFNRFLIATTIFFFYFYEHIQRLFGSVVTYLAVFICGLAIINMIRNRGLSAMSRHFSWLLVFLVFLVRNQVLINRTYMVSFFMGLMAFLVAFSLGRSSDWHSTAIKYFLLFGELYAVATIICFFLPNAASLQYAFWGVYPSGMENGLYSYRAGIASQCSANGIYISVALLIHLSRLVTSWNKGERGNTRKIVMAGILIVAMLLTAKRGVLIFSIASIIIVFLILSKQRIIGRVFKLVVGGTAIIVLLTIAVYFVPVLGDTFARFTDGGDDISTGRYFFWEYAFETFLEQPIFGIGWFGFRFIQLPITYTAGYYDVHCVYIQLLCETGLVGCVVVVSAMLHSCFDTMKQYKRLVGNDKNSSLVISAIIQLFILFYAITGNALYDRCIILYLLSLALSWSSIYSLNDE